MKTRGFQTIVVCGPSGSGKSTLLRRLLAEHGDKFAFTVSHTTRRPRKGELDQRDYHFVEPAEMLRLIGQNEFIEYTHFSGNYYGTSRRAVRDVLRQGKHLVIEVDIEGVKALHELKELNPVFVFLRPPSKRSLQERLAARGTETGEQVRRRLERADAELAFAQSGHVHFDMTLVNDNLDEAYKSLKHFLCLPGA